MGKLTYYGRVKNGEIILPKRVKKEVVQNFDGHEIEVAFKDRRKTRSNYQNNYYWGVVLPEFAQALSDLGNKIQVDAQETHKTLHKTLLSMFCVNGDDLVLSTGEAFKLSPTSTTMTTIEFTEYINEIRDFAAQNMNYYIPEPQEQKEIAFKL